MSDQPQDDLNFDRAEPAQAAPAPGAGVTCRECGRTITDTYHTANGMAVCSACRVRIEAATRGVTEPALIAKAALFGLGAAIVGAVIYWAVMRFANLEIGLIAILTGWMVGKAVRAGANGRGGRLLQVGSAALVYLSVAMAYLPFAVASMRGEAAVTESASTQDVTPNAAAPEAAALEPDSTTAAGDAAPQVSEGTESVSLDGPRTSTGFLVGVLALFVFALALPVFAIMGSMPSGLISALIIGFGMVQAWQLTGRPVINFEGPFRVGGTPPA